MTEEKTETLIERHQVSRFGNPIQFATQSKKYREPYGDSHLQERIDHLKKAAAIEDENARSFAISLIDSIEKEQNISNELRLRFQTMEDALIKINDSLKSDQG